MDVTIDKARIIEDEIKPIHPALDFTDDMAIITIPLPTQKMTKEKGGGINLSVNQDYWVVTDKKEVFLLDDKELLDRNYYPSGTCYVLTNRWHYSKSLKIWLETDLGVDPGAVFSKIRQSYDYYLDYRDSRLYSYLTIWSIGTYFFPLFNAYPIVFLNGGSGSGKSKTIDVTEQLAFNAINTSNISDASIFRIIQGTRATMLLDENEKIANQEEAKTLINLVLAGFKKGAKVIRLETDKSRKFIPTPFEVHCPKMIANIRGIYEDALKNRCVIFIMTPTQGRKSNTYPIGEDKEWQVKRDMLYLFMMNHWKEIREVKNEIVASNYDLNGYAFMMWHPILTIAKYLERYVGKEIFDEMVSLAKQKTSERKAETMENYDRQLLKTIAYMMDPCVSGEERDNSKFLSSNLIFENYKLTLGFDRDNIPKWLVPQKVGRMTKSLDIGNSKTEIVEGRQTRGFWINKERLSTMLNRFGINDVC